MIPIENLQIISILSKKKKYRDMKKVLNYTNSFIEEEEENKIDLSNFKKLIYFAEINLKNLFSFYNSYNNKKTINSVYKLISNWKKIKQFYIEILNNLEDNDKHHKKGLLKKEFYLFLIKLKIFLIKIKVIIVKYGFILFI